MYRTVSTVYQTFTEPYTKPYPKVQLFLHKTTNLQTEPYTELFPNRIPDGYRTVYLSLIVFAFFAKKRSKIGREPYLPSRTLGQTIQTDSWHTECGPLLTEPLGDSFITAFCIHLQPKTTPPKPKSKIQEQPNRITQPYSGVSWVSPFRVPRRTWIKEL